MSRKTNYRILTLILALLMLTSCFVSCAEEPQFVPPPFDESAVVGVPEISDPDAIGYNEVETPAYKLSVCGRVELQGNKADIYLTNPETNNVWIKVRVLDKNGNTLGETGLVRPGEYVQTITFDKVPKKGDAIVLKIMGYQPDTYYSAGAANLNTTIY